MFSPVARRAVPLLTCRHKRKLTVEVKYSKRQPLSDRLQVEGPGAMKGKCKS